MLLHFQEVIIFFQSFPITAKQSLKDMISYGKVSKSKRLVEQKKTKKDWISLIRDYVSSRMQGRLLVTSKME